MKNLSELKDITTIHSLFLSGELGVVEFTKYHLNKAKELNPKLNAFITITEDHALKSAEESENRYKKKADLGLLDGIPMSVKDVICVKGTITTASSQILKDYVSPYTATGIQRLLDKGCVLIGKNNSDPFGFGGSGENSGFGATHNPLDITRVPGGSSSGSAASVAAGIGIFSIGTDTGGSVRNPASLTGIVGFKPSYGRNSRYGLISMASSFDTMGVLSNFVKDTAIIEEALSGFDPLDSTTHNLGELKLTENLDKDIKGIKVGLPKEYFIDGLDEEIKESVFKQAEKLKSLGCEIVDISLPHTKYALPAYYILVPSEISSNQGRFDGIRFGNKENDVGNLEEQYIKTREKYEDEVKRRIIIGTFALSSGYADEYYKNALKIRELIKQDFNEAFKKVDIILTPSMPRVAWKIGEEVNDPLKLYLEDIFTVTANLAGIPGISIPSSFKNLSNEEVESSENISGEKCTKLPIGNQLLAKRFDEEILLRVASKLN